MPKIRSYILLLIIAAASSGSGQSITQGTVVSSLSKDILYIHQDKHNNYWFGSHTNGIYRYDGKTLVHFTERNGLPSNNIVEIKENNAGDLFFNTAKGIVKHNGNAFTLLIPIASTPLHQNEWKRSPDDVWLKAEGGKKGVYRWDGHALYLLPFPKHYMEDAYYAKYGKPTFVHSPYEAYYIYTDKRDHIWIGTANLGLCRFDGRSLSWMYEDSLTWTRDGGTFGIRSIYEDKNGQFWICNANYRFSIQPTDSSALGHKLIRYRKHKGIEAKAPDCQGLYIFTFIEDNKGDLWMSTYRDGIWRYNGKTTTQYLIKNGKDITTTYKLYKDNQGTLWLGTHENGVYKFNGKEFVPFKL